MGEIESEFEGIDVDTRVGLFEGDEEIVGLNVG